MALFAPKLNPADVQLEYSSRIDAVAYPCIRQSALAGKMMSGEPGRRKEIAKALETAVEREFLHQDDARPFAKIQSPAYVRSLLVLVGPAAGVDYQRNLEQHLQENPREPILPQKYRYDIDGKVFDKAKLIKI